MKSSGSSGSGGGETKVERKTIEKQRRMQMKSLSMKLASLIPRPRQQKQQDAVTQLDSLEEAASYIISLRGRIEELKERKESAGRRSAARRCREESAASAFKLPIIEVRYQKPNLEVVLITKAGACQKPTFHQLVRIIEEEGGDVVNASHSTLADKLLYTIHSQLRSPRTASEASRLSNRLKDWIHAAAV